MYLKEVSMDDKLREHLLGFIQARISGEVSEKLGVLARGYNSSLKGLNLSKTDERAIQTEILNMIKQGCDEYCEKMLNRIAAEGSAHVNRILSE